MFAGIFPAQSLVILLMRFLSVVFFIITPLTLLVYCSTRYPFEELYPETYVAMIWDRSELDGYLLLSTWDNYLEIETKRWQSNRTIYGLPPSL
ncbi:hypothetical protein VCRA2120O333_20060 [Vibrio crassostreae]|nr:hypothetical protein VCRA2121O334_20061 [Vibrio crassostreae]CAK3853430.1 hypothetical protein VCRA2120O333_20060 [Vibrio crassostreae]